MKTLFLLSLLLTISIRVFSQEFNGTVTYKVEIKNPMPDLVSDSSYFAGIGGHNYFTKVCQYMGNEYKTTSYLSDDSPKKIELLNSKSDRFYTFVENSDSATYADISSNTMQIIEIIRNSELEKVNGIDCQSAKFKTNMGEITVHFSKQFTITPSRYSSFKYGLFDQILAEINSVPLRIEIKNFLMHMIETVTCVKIEDIPQQNFALPAFKHAE
jgi:hypothetical protein